MPVHRSVRRLARTAWAAQSGCPPERHDSSPSFLRESFMPRPTGPLFAAALLAAFATLACARGDQPTALRRAPSGGPLLSSGVPDTSALPDLIVDGKSTQNNWLVRVEDLPADF